MLSLTTNARLSQVAGTTRDAADISYDRAGERHTLIDTVPPALTDGQLRRSLLAMRAERSIRRADLCLLVVDLAAGITVGS